MTNRSPEARHEVDTLLRTTLADDLPPEVEDRLNEQVERFLAVRRRRVRRPLSGMFDRFVGARASAMLYRAGLGLRLAGCAALVVCGIALHGPGASHVFAASVVRVRESAALWRAIERAPSMQCSDAARDDLGSSAEFADRIYRRWVLVRVGRDVTGALHLTFTSPSDSAQYDVHVDRESMLPNRVVKTPLGGTAPPRSSSAGYDAGCRWDMQPPQERADGKR